MTKRAAARKRAAHPSDASGMRRPDVPLRPARRRLGRLLLANVGLFAALVLALELGARLLFPRSVGAMFDDPQAFVRGRPFIVPDARRGFALRPGFHANGITINSAGLRGLEPPADLERRKRILALGESSTFGWKVNDDETYPANLQRLLDRMHPDSICVLNAGVPSYTSAQTLLYLKDLLPRYRPHAVVIGVCWNDVLYSCLPNWMPEILVHQQPARWRQLLLRRSGLYRALTQRRSEPSPAAGHDNPAALAYYEANLESMIAACQRQGARVLLLPPSMDPAHIPDSGMKIWRGVVPKPEFVRVLQRWSAAMEEIGRKQGVPVLRHPLMQGDAAHTALFIDPVHLTGPGNALLAEQAASVLTESAFLSAPAGDSR